MALSCCNHFFRCLVQKVLTQRLRTILILFLPNDCIPNFWTLLLSSKSCVMGGIVACAMTGARYASFHADTAPVQMDIVIPANLTHPSAYSSWKHLLLSMDYQLCVPRSCPGTYTICVARVELYKHAVCFLQSRMPASHNLITDHKSFYLLTAQQYTIRP